MTDRSASLLAELQAVCQRILVTDTRNAEGQAALTTMASVANGTAVANSLEALRRQCVDNHESLIELKRSVDGHRGVVAGDSAANGKMLIELRRAVEALTEVAQRDRAVHEGQLGELVRSVESLRVGLAGFSANNRQQVSEIRGSLESVERTVAAFGSQTQAALNTLGGQIQSALDTLRQHVALALEALSEHVGRRIDGQTVAYDALREQVGQQIDRQVAGYDAMIAELRPDEARQRVVDLEKMLSVVLPSFSEEIQASVQQTLLEVSRTFQQTETEHGNRMAELHRDFDTTTRRLEAALLARRREGSVN